MIYLAGPIDQISTNSPVNELRALARSIGVALFDPSRAFRHADKDPDRMHRINQAALHTCDGMLALLPKGVPTIGTPMEVQAAHNAGIPVAVISGTVSFQLAGMGVRTWPETSEGIEQALLWLEAEAVGAGTRGNGKQAMWTGHDDLEPVRHHHGDAGFDLFVAEDSRINSRQHVDVPCGVKMQLPEGVWGLLTGRSSTMRKLGLVVTQGIIDQGYRGDLYVGVWNPNDKSVWVRRGDRIAQIIPLPVIADSIKLKQVSQLATSERGDAGFGSTGGHPA